MIVASTFRIQQRLVALGSIIVSRCMTSDTVYNAITNRIVQIRDKGFIQATDPKTLMLTQLCLLHEQETGINNLF